MTRPRILLHVGAPKCGSSALQTALSEARGLSLPDGRLLTYTAARADKSGGWVPQTGLRLRMMAARAPHGYAAWPDLGQGDATAAGFAALNKVWSRSDARHLPMVSQEGWIDRAALFHDALPHWFTPQEGVTVFAAARPPLEWINAAWWQWGIWSGLSFDQWLERRVMPYRLGTALTDWASLPGVCLQLDLGGDVVAGFAARQGLSLPAASRNAALPPALLGFLLRNRRFRPHGHASQVDFVFQRWCNVRDAPRLWAIRGTHVKMIWTEVRAEVDRLMALVPDEQWDQTLQLRAGWRQAKVYEQAMSEAPTRLHKADQQAVLFEALCDGVAAVSRKLGRKPPALPFAPRLRRSSHEERDAPMAQVLETLIALDADWRRRRLWSL